MEAAAPVVDYAVLETLGVGVDDSVEVANEKRTSEYERQAQTALEYAYGGYLEDWAARPQREGRAGFEDWVTQHRSAYKKSFEVKREGETQLAVSITIERRLQQLLVEARDDIINELCSLVGTDPAQASDMHKSPVWVPDIASIPQKDLHITICIPSLWRARGDEAERLAYNATVHRSLAEAAAKHLAFQVEVDRLALGKDGSLIALFRTVGPQSKGEGAAESLHDRGSGMRDPMTALRADLITTFFAHSLADCQRNGKAPEPEHPHRLLHQATIVKTVGGSVHGYIHCSLCRLAIAPQLTLEQVDLQKLLQVVRSWSARLSGRRMHVRQFRLSEMTGTGLGGNKNPFDCSIWDRDIQLKVQARPAPDCFSAFRAWLGP